MENPILEDAELVSSLPTFGDYLESKKGIINLICAFGAFLLTLAYFPYVKGDFSSLFIALIFTAGIVLNRWKAVFVAAFVTALPWWILFHNLYNWVSSSSAYTLVSLVHFVGVIFIIVLIYGFVLERPIAAFASERRNQPDFQAPGLWYQFLGVHQPLSSVGKNLYKSLDSIFSLDNILPPFIESQDKEDAIFDPADKLLETDQDGVTQVVSPAALVAFPLYLITIIVEAFGATTRSVIFSIGFLPIAWLIVSKTSYYYGFEEIAIAALIPGLLLGFFPILLSLFHYLLPFFRTGAGADAERFGARRPTREEMENINETGESIRERAQELGKVPASPGEWMVIDNNVSAESYTIGSTIYVTSYAAKSEHLAGLAAHELGHLAHRDGDVILALRRLVIPFAYFYGIDRQPLPAGSVFATGGAALGAQQVITDDMKLFYRMKMLPLKFSMSFWYGGLGMFIMGRQWANFWRHRDFLADEYAAAIGLRDDLMSVLEAYEHVDVAQPYLLTNRPYTAERLDRLKG